MSARITSAAGNLQSASVGGNALTIAGWFVRNGATPADDTALSILGSGSIAMQLNAATTAFSVWDNSVNTNFVYQLLATRWMFMAFVMRSATDYTGYIKPVGQPGFLSTQKVSRTNNDGAVAQLQVGTDVSGEFWQGYSAHVKVWTRAMSEIELDLESLQLMPFSRNALWAYWPLANGGRDISGRGHNLTVTAPVTFLQYDPPVPLVIQPFQQPVYWGKSPTPLFVSGYYV